ncbi:MAG: hypothetical protein K2I46_00415, partial [Clostridia bacterium]|nr:hypothetical protein [Clostridia bacterium]
LMDKIYRGNPPINFFEEIEDLDVISMFSDDKATAKGKVVYNGVMAEYYRGGKLIFSVEDKGCEAFFKDSVARYLLSDNQPESAIELLSTVKLSKLKNDIRLCCHQTLVIAHCILEEYDKAYEYCELLIQNNVFMPEMTDICFHLYKVDSPHFEEMKNFFLSYDSFDSAQLAEMHSLAREIDDEDFWNSIYANNPIGPRDVSEDSYILKGILAFNSRDYASADRLFKQATSIYGRFGKSWLLRYYVEYYQEKYKKSLITRNMPEELFTGRLDDMYNFIDKKFLSKLKKCQSRDDFLKNVDDNMLELDNMLSGVFAKICDVADIVNRVYKMNYLPARELINKVIVDGDYNAFIRVICLANYMMFSPKKRFVFGKEVYDNPFVSVINPQVGGDKEPFAYGIAIYLAGTIFQGISNSEFKKEYGLLKKIYSKAKADYTGIAPLAVFGVLFAYVNDEKVQYVKDAVKRREVRDFINTYFNEGGYFSEDENELDDDVFDFMRFCFEFHS